MSNQHNSNDGKYMVDVLSSFAFKKTTPKKSPSKEPPPSSIKENTDKNIKHDTKAPGVRREIGTPSKTKPAITLEEEKESSSLKKVKKSQTKDQDKKPQIEIKSPKTSEQSQTAEIQLKPKEK